MGTVFTNQMTASRQFEGDGARDEFPFDFDVFDSGDVAISLDGETVETGFHVTLGRSGTGAGSTAARGAARGAGGIVKFETAPASGVRIDIARSLRLRRLSSYDAMSVPRGDAIDRDLDFVTVAIGDIDRALSGALHLDAADRDQASAKLPAIAPGRVLIWNDEGDGLANGPDAGDIANVAGNATLAQAAANRAEAADARSQTALASFGRDHAGAMLDLDFRSGNALSWEDERRQPVIDAPLNRIMDIRETGALVRLSNGARVTLPDASIARNGVRYRLFNGDGTQVDIAAASGDVIAPVHGGAEGGIYPLPIRGDMVDLVCDGITGGRWFACPVRESGPVVKLLRTASQSIPAGGAFLIEWDQVVEDSHGLYDAASHGLTGMAPGFYHIDVGVSFPVTSEAVMTTLSLERFNGTDWNIHLQSNDITATGSGANHSLRLGGVVRIAPGGASGLRIRLRHSDDVTRMIAASDLLSWWHLHRIGG
ncbi:hypothetical protein [uncultured Thalassospira sp.]|uniref:hypothetical protein n=1 Tax=uncultured Thalassospira sp. TaxID=404382 RepID=UPI00259805DF|nr:hypothetical protein [uncultured Thalassospira sp.]